MPRELKTKNLKDDKYFIIKFPFLIFYPAYYFILIHFFLTHFNSGEIGCSCKMIVLV